MQWLESPEEWEILGINKNNKTCYVFADGRYYGSPIRVHNDEMYFSIFDNCIWYRIPDSVRQYGEELNNDN